MEDWSVALNHTVNEAINRLGRGRSSPLFTRPEPVGFAQHLTAVKGAPSPGLPSDLRLYIRIETDSETDARHVLAAASVLPDVELAYLEPRYEVPPPFDVDNLAEVPLPACTPDFCALQRHLDAAPGGLDARFAWGCIPAGAAGAGVVGGDVEGGWVRDHEDLGGSDRIRLVNGPMSDEPRWVQHGTACLGLGVGVANGRGISGIAPDVDAVLCGTVTGDGDLMANSINLVATALATGDVLLIEVHARCPVGPGGPFVPYVPIEYWPAVYDAICHATHRGIIVVAAAGDGYLNLDDPIFGRAFDRTFRDSGSIIVGAGAPPLDDWGPDRSRLDFSNWGACVDVQGYGESVCTTGYGDLQGELMGDVRRWYTTRFRGTSSATPMIWGAALLLQSIAKRAGGLITPRDMRALLISTGSEQTDARDRPRTQRIGPRPNLRQALTRLGLA